MKIFLKEGYFVETDPLNFTLKKTQMGTRKGEEVEVEKTIGYYNKLDGALERFLKLMRSEGKEDAVISIAEYMDELKKADKENRDFISELVKGLKYGGS